MKGKSGTLLKQFGTGLLLGLFIVILAACSSDGGKKSNGENDNGNTEGNQERDKITIMTTTFSTEPPTKKSEVWQALEEYTDTDITVEWAINSNYADKLNITFGSGDLPHIVMVPEKMPSFINAVRDGAFWDLTDHLKDYPNLSKANEIVLQNSMIDGRVYGVYRSRPLGRNGVSIRKDWLENLDLEIPTTIDEFYEVLRAFTFDDPDGNGKDDTYGMTVSKYSGPWDQMQIWFGAPNKWGEDADGNLQPDFMTDEYRDALQFFKKLYDEGLVNEDFAVMDSGEWMKPIKNHESGVLLNVLDEGHRVQEAIIEADPSYDDPIDVFDTVEGPKGKLNLPTLGYNGMFAISKSKVKTEEDLKKVLGFLDKLNDKEAQILASNGLEGTHYEFKDEEFVPLATEANGLIKDYESLNQLIPYIPEDLSLTTTQSDLRNKENQIIKENEDIVVPNPGVSLISDVYASKGQQLDNIIEDARIKFIGGQTDEKGLDDAIELWLKSGGKEYIDEMNELYKDIK